MCQRSQMQSSKNKTTPGPPLLSGSTLPIYPSKTQVACGATGQPLHCFSSLPPYRNHPSTLHIYYGNELGLSSPFTGLSSIMSG